MIPRRIIQTGRSLENLSPVERECAASVANFCPEYEMIFMSDHDVEVFVCNEFPDFAPIMEGFETRIQEFDLFRYLAVYRMGGFYMDLDVELHSSLEPLVNHDCVFPYEKLTVFPWLKQRGIPWQLGQYAFGAKAGHPFLSRVIDVIKEEADRGRDAGLPFWFPPGLRPVFSVYHSTGPGLVSRVLADSADLEVTVVTPRDTLQYNRFGSGGTHRAVGTWKDRLGPYSRRWLQHSNRSARYQFGHRNLADLVGPNVQIERGAPSANAHHIVVPREPPV